MGTPHLTADVPTVDEGLTVLASPSARSNALHQLVVDELRERDGETLWVDCRNNASSYALFDLAPSDRVLDSIRVSRAFTAYQHYSLVTELVRRADADTSLVVVPCIASLYRDDDVPNCEARALLDSALTVLAELAETLDVPVLCTVTGDDDLARLVDDAAASTIECRETPMGLAFEADDFETLVYWHEGVLQTTIPYWVDLFGVAREPGPASVALDRDFALALDHPGVA